MADDSVIKLEKTILKIEAARSAENAKAKKETDAHRVELEKLAAKRNELGQFQSKEQRTNAQNEIDQLDRIKASNEEILKSTANTLSINSKELEARTAQAQFLTDQKESLAAMEASITAQGGIATENKKYNQLSLQIQQQELDLRAKTADTPAAKKAIADEQARINSEQAGLLGKIAGGITSLKEGAKEKMKSAGKGLMTVLKGTLVAGFLVAVLAFLNSEYWVKTKKYISEVILPKIKGFYNAFFGKGGGFFKGISELFGDKSGLGAIVVGIGGITALLVAGKLAKVFGPLKAGIGLLTGGLSRITGMIPKIPGLPGGKTPKGPAMPKGPAKASSAGKKFGQVIGNIGKGLGKGIRGILQGLALGLKAFANPKVLIGAGILAGSILVIGAGIAGASYLLGKAFPVLTNGLKTFEGLDGEKLKTVAVGIGAIGLALFALGAGGAVGGLGTMVGAITGSIGKFFGAKDPLTQLKRFGEAKINAAQAKKNAEAMVVYAKAMAAGARATATEGLGSFVGGITGSIGRFFGGKDKTDPLTQLKRFGSVAVNAKNIANNAAAMKDYAQAMKDYPQTPVKLGDSINNALGSLSSFLGIKKKTESPLQKLQNFGLLKVDSANIKTNAEAMTLYGNAMKTLPTPTGGWSAVGTFVGGVFSSLGKLVGLEQAKSPLEKLKEFGEFEIGAKALKRIPETANAMTLYGKAMANVPKPAGGWESIGKLFGGIAESFLSLFGSSDKPTALEQLKTFGEMPINTGGVAVNSKAFITWSEAMGKGAPLLKKAFKDFKIPEDAVDALKSFAALGQVGAGLSLASNGIRTLGDSMAQFMLDTKDLTSKQLRKMGLVIRTFLLPFAALIKNQRGQGGGFIDSVGKLMNSITEMTKSGAMEKFDVNKFRFPVPNNNEVINMNNFSIATARTVAALKMLGIEGPKAFKALENTNVAIPVRVVGDVRVAEMRARKLDAAGKPAGGNNVAINASKGGDTNQTTLSVPTSSLNPAVNSAMGQWPVD